MDNRLKNDEKIETDACKVSKVGDNKSCFCGSFLKVWAYSFLVALSLVFTLGIATPWVICKKQRYIAANTYINGRCQCFDGNPKDLLLKMLIWLGLNAITLGIYAYFVPMKKYAWIVEHTHFEDYEGGAYSSFHGNNFEFMGMYIHACFISVITLGLGSAWTINRYYKYLINNTVIDGQTLKYNGKATKLFPKTLLLGLLSVITLGLGVTSFSCFKEKFTVSNTNFFFDEKDNDSRNGIPASKLIETNVNLSARTTVLLTVGLSLIAVSFISFIAYYFTIESVAILALIAAAVSAISLFVSIFSLLPCAIISHQEGFNVKKLVSILTMAILAFFFVISLFVVFSALDPILSLGFYM